MTTAKSTPTKPKKIRTIQTVRFGTSKVDLKLARKTLREMMREQKEHAATSEGKARARHQRFHQLSARLHRGGKSLRNTPGEALL